MQSWLLPGSEGEQRDPEAGGSAGKAQPQKAHHFASCIARNAGAHTSSPPTPTASSTHQASSSPPASNATPSVGDVGVSAAGPESSSTGLDVGRSNKHRRRTRCAGLLSANSRYACLDDGVKLPAPLPLLRRRQRFHHFFFEEPLTSFTAKRHTRSSMRYSVLPTTASACHCSQ